MTDGRLVVYFMICYDVMICLMLFFVQVVVEEDETESAMASVQQQKEEELQVNPCHVCLNILIYNSSFHSDVDCSHCEHPYLQYIRLWTVLIVFPFYNN